MDANSIAPLDATTFEVNEAEKTISVQTDDVSKVGSYVVSYKVGLTLWPLVT